MSFVSDMIRVQLVMTGADQHTRKLGQALADRLSYVTCGDTVDPSADVTYFMALEGYHRATSTCARALGWIGSPSAPSLSLPVLNAALQMDAVVVAQTRLRDQLTSAGVQDVSVIAPWTRDAAQDKALHIGVIGSEDDGTDALLSHLAGHPEVDLRFACPGAGPAPDMSAFLRSLDYLLVPSPQSAAVHYMSAALAVHADVMIAEGLDLPHDPARTIRFDPADEAGITHSIRNALERRNSRYDALEGQAMDCFAQAHDRLFKDHAARNAALSDDVPFSRPVRLLMHGKEQTTLGGPSVRIPRTAATLRDIGIRAQSGTASAIKAIPEDVVHLFNVWDPLSALSTMRALKMAGKTVVFSPIFLDFSARAFWQHELPKLPLDDLDALAEQRGKMRAHMQGRGRLHEPLPGFHAIVRALLELADHVIFLSVTERAALEAIGARVDDDRASVIANPVDAALWSDNNPDLFRAKYLSHLAPGQDYVVCVGRIEERKNQLLLAHALRDAAMPLVLIGHVGSADYARRVRQEGGAGLLILDRLPPGGEMLRSAVAGARLFALPSWAEGTSLAALEAAAAGTDLVLSDFAAARDCFGALAHYCDPGDPVSIRTAVEAACALDPETLNERQAALHDLVRSRHNWQDHAYATAAAYKAAVHAPKPPSVSAPGHPRAVERVLVDVSPQVARSSADQMTDLVLGALRAAGTEMQMICHRTDTRDFAWLPGRFQETDQALRFARAHAAAGAPLRETPDDAIVLVTGGAWCEQPGYLRALEDLKMRSGCGIAAILYDMTALHAPAFFTASAVDMFRENLIRLLALCDRVLVTSQRDHETLAELVPLCSDGQRVDLQVLSLDALTGDVHAGEAGTGIQRDLDGICFALAFGDVGPVSNTEMLYRVWTRLAETGTAPDLHLVVVGGITEEGAGLAEKLGQVPGVHILDKVTATDLEWLYQNSLFTVIPTRQTGWSLPAAQSVARGKPSLISTSCSLSEGTSARISRIDPEDFPRWYAQICTLGVYPAARIAAVMGSAGDTQTKPTAAEVADNMSATIQAPLVVQTARPVLAGQVLRADADAPPLPMRLRAGWQPVEQAGRWMSDERAELVLSVQDCLRSDLERLTVLLNLLVAPPFQSYDRVIISCKTQVLFDIDAQSCPSAVFVCVPVSACEADGSLSLVIQGPASGRVGLRSVVCLDPQLSNPLGAAADPHLFSDGTQKTVMDMADADQRAVVASGLAFSPAWGVGTRNGRCTLLLPFLPGSPAQSLCVTVRPIAACHAPVTSVIKVNGKTRATRRWTGSMPDTFTVSVEAADLARSGPAVLTIDSGSLSTPQDLDLGASTDHSGFGVLDLCATPVTA
ncbi:MAG: glycosyltransferase [Pseudomonadota bacterium]